MAQQGPHEPGRQQRRSQCTTAGCVGICIAGGQECLAHADEHSRDKFLAQLQPGSGLNLTGVPLDRELLEAILDALTAEDGRAEFGTAVFRSARFSGDIAFDRARFTQDANFNGAEFNGFTAFRGTRFSRVVWFREAEFRSEVVFDLVQFSSGAAIHFEKAQFSKDCWFRGAQFNGTATFEEAQFGSEATAHFEEAQFGGDAVFKETRFGHTAAFKRARFGLNASFQDAQFDGDIAFHAMQVSGAAIFRGAQFREAGRLGPLLAVNSVDLDGVSFDGAMVIQAITAKLSCIEARFAAATTLRLRWADVILDNAVFTKPCTLAYVAATWGELTAERSPTQKEFRLFERPQYLPDLDEPAMVQPGREAKPRLLSLRGVDVSMLVTSELDLGMCLLWGAHHLDQLRIEGPNPFLTTPKGWQVGYVLGRELPVWRWTRRQTAAEEHAWRARRQGLRDPSDGRPHPKRAGWQLPPPELLTWIEEHSGRPVEWLEPDRLALLYRRLRKGREDTKNEPGAADFYYGEMEMRRAAVETPWSERVILLLYWLVSGYGLRGLRALGWLAGVIAVLAVLLQAIGFNGSDPTFGDAVIYATQSTLSLQISNKALTEHVSWAGEVLRIILRLSGPVLLGLALLSIRNRVKR